MTTLLKKGDQVQVRAGKNRGKSGKVLAVNRKAERIVVEGVNTKKRHAKPRKQGEKGQIVTVERSVALGSVMLVCGACNKATRIGRERKDGKVMRVCKHCGKSGI